MTGDLFMCSWTLNLQTSCVPNTVVLDGMLECSFAPDGRIQKLILSYDSMAVANQVEQLRQASTLMHESRRAQEQLCRSTMGPTHSMFSNAAGSNLLDFSQVSAAMQSSGSFLGVRSRPCAAMTGGAAFGYGSPMVPLSI